MRLLLLLFFMFIGGNVFSQDAMLSRDSSVIVGEIIVSGNKKTKTNIILREMFLKKGDTLSIKQLQEKIELSREFIFNTTLFIDIKIETAKQDNNKVAIIVLVKERWYLFPLPYFRLVDRNFNEWWVNHHRDFSRVNYGIKFNHTNLSGNNDKLNIWLITGYNQQITLRYDRPFCNKKLTNGFSFSITQSTQKEVNFQTDSFNKQQFFNVQDNFAKRFTRIDAAFSMRPDKNFRHTFRVGYSAEKIADSVAIKNPNYYGDNITSLNYIDFSYSLQYFNTNYNTYPTKGFIGGFNFYHRGVDKISTLTQISASSLFAKPISKKMFIRNETAATIKFPYNSNFISQNLFGYGGFQLRGLENYVVDGMVGLQNKFSLGYEMFTKYLKLPIKSNTYNRIPFRFYAKVFADVGYAYNPYLNYNLLNNKLMYTYGIGLDIVTIYDFVFKLEFGVNQLGGRSLFLER